VTGAEREDGVAMLIAMVAVLLMTALGAALILTSSSETIVAGHFQDNLEARYAAGAMIERGMDDVGPVEDWSPLIDGLQRSSWIDGPPAGPRTLPDGSTLDLGQALNLASCQKSAACSQSDLALVTGDRPWGANNPRWALYAYGPLRNLLPSPSVIQSACYVLLLVGTGPSPALLAMRAEAFCSHGAHAIVEVTLGRASRLGDGRDYNDDPGQGAVKILSWREVR
jgi:hypothetical protein